MAMDISEWVMMLSTYFRLRSHSLLIATSDFGPQA